MGRVLLERPEKTPEARARKFKKLRGWRSFTTVAVKDATVVIEAGGLRCEVTADRGGFIDSVVQADLQPGWQTVRHPAPRVRSRSTPRCGSSTRRCGSGSSPTSTTR